MAQIKAVEEKNKARIWALCPHADERSGIYVFTRTDEEGFKFAYIGQAKHMLTRLAQHLSGYQHIDLSIKKHGLCDEGHPCGWKVRVCLYCPENDLDFEEQDAIKRFADAGYQLRNKTTGSQGEGRAGISYESRKGYLQGKKDGYDKAHKEFIELLQKADGDGIKAKNAQVKLNKLKGENKNGR
jgi:hypothetical protein